MLQRTGQTQLFSFDPISGSPVEDMSREGVELKFVVKQVSLVQELSEKFVRPLLMLDTSGEVSSQSTKHSSIPVHLKKYYGFIQFHVYPTSLTSLVQRKAPFLFMFTVESNSGVVSGLSVKSSVCVLNQY